MCYSQIKGNQFSRKWKHYLVFTREFLSISPFFNVCCKIIPRLKPLFGCQKRKLAQTNKEKLEAVLSQTPKLTTLFASRNNIVAENPDENISLQSIEASNQENQEVTSG